MSPRNLGLLVLVAALLGAFVYFYEVRGGAERKEAAQEAKHLFADLDAKSVSAIELKTVDGKPAKLSRTDKGWEVVEPLHYPADELNADGMTTALSELSSDKEIPSPQEASVYGLDDTARVVRFTASGKEHVLRIGKKTPVGSDTYVAADDSPRVFTVPTYRANAFLRTLDELREARILRFDREAIERIELSWPGGGVTLARQEGSWRLLAPLQGPADGTAVDTLLANLSYLRASGFEDQPMSDAEAGLDPPDLRVELVGKPAKEGAEAPHYVLAIGRTNDRKTRVVRTDSPTLFRIATERLDDFPHTVLAYRDKEVAHFDVRDAERVEIAFQGPQGEVRRVLEHAPSGWTAGDEKLVAGKAERLVAELSHLKGKDIVGEGMDAAALAPLGLEPPRVTLRVLPAPPKEGGEARPLATIELGTLDAKTGLPARAADGNTVFRLDPALAEHLPTSLEAWQGRFLEKPGAAKASAAAAPAEPAENGEPAAGGGAAEEPERP